MKSFVRGLRSLIVVAFLVLIAQPAKADLISIDLSGIANVPPAVVQRFALAEQFWENNLGGFRADLPRYVLNQLGTIEITGAGQAIDGPGGVLGMAGPDQANLVQYQIGRGKGGANALQRSISQGGDMLFDTDDYGANLIGLPFEVIVHEMAHVLGFGSLWDDVFNEGFLRGRDPRGGPKYVAQYGLRAWREDNNMKFADGVPIEKLGGDGTRDAHWDSQDPYFSNEMLIGFAGGTDLTFTSLQSFKDLGFAVDDEVGNDGSGARGRKIGPKNGPSGPGGPSFVYGGGSNSVPEPASAAVIGLIGLCGLGFARRRRR